MKRSLRMSNDINLREHDDGTWDVIIGLNNRTLVSFILELSLLSESLIDELDFIDKKEIVLTLSLIKKSKFSKSERHATHLNIQLPPRDLEFMRSFALKYYRDGQAEVDHIDVNLYGQNRVEQGMLIVKAADAKPGIAGDEARHILGLI